MPTIKGVIKGSYSDIGGEDGEGTTIPDPARELANSLARMRMADPKAADDYIKRYGPDIDPAILAKAGIQLPKPDDGGVLGKLKRTGLGALGRVFDAIDTPRNMVIGGIKEGWGGVGGAVMHREKFGTLLPEGGGAKGAIARFGEMVLTDPLTYLTLGTGTAAKAGLKGIGATLGKEVAEQAAKSGIRTLDETVVRKALLRAAEGQGAKDAERVAAKQFTALEKGAQGGLKLGMPFAEGRTLIPASAMPHPLARLSEMHPVSNAVGRGLGTARSAAGRAFTPRSEIARHLGQDIADEVGQAQSVGRGQAARGAEAFTGRLVNTLKDSGVAEAELPLVMRHLEGATDVALSPAGVQVADDLRAAGEELTQRELAAGVLRPEQVRTDYVAHTLTPAGRKVANANQEVFDQIMAKRGEADNILSQGGHTRERAFDTVDEAEAALVEQFGELPKGRTYWEHNPARAMASRAVYAERAMGFNRTIDELERTGIVTAAPAPPPAAPSVAPDVAKAQRKVTSLKRRLAFVNGELVDTPLREVRRGAKGGHVSGLPGQGVITDPIPNLERLQRKVNLQEELATQTAHLDELREAQKAASAGAKAAADAVQAPPGMAVVSVNEAGRKVFAPVEVAADLNKARAVVTNNDDLRAMAAFASDVNRYWKGIATVLPVRGTGFFARNAIGNPALMFVRGFRNPARFVEAGLLKHAAAKGDEAAIQSIHELEDTAVWGSGFFDVDLPVHSPALEGKPAQGLGERLREAPVKEGAAVLGRAAKRHAKGEGKGLAAGRKLNSTIEDNARAAMYLDLRAKGLAPTDAAIEVKKTLFDYADLTDVERKVLKPYIAFYTFMRKNLGAQAYALMHNPGTLSAQAHAYSAVAGSGQETGGPLPGYAVEQGGVPVGGKLAKLLGGGGSNVLVSPDLPIGAAAETASAIVNPAILAASLLPGGKGLQKLSGSPADVARDALNVPSGAGIEVLRAGVQTATGKSLLTGRDIPAGSEDESLVSALVPLLATIQRTQKKVKDDQFINMFLGLNTTAVTPARQASETYRRADELEAALKALRKAGVNAPTMKELRDAGQAPPLERKRKGLSTISGY